MSQLVLKTPVCPGTESGLLDKTWRLEISPFATCVIEPFATSVLEPCVLWLPNSSVCPSQGSGAGLSVSFGVGVTHGV